MGEKESKESEQKFPSDFGGSGLSINLIVVGSNSYRN